ncbi:hypothetical protein [Acinetobacter nematophilus]|uniref:Uncharacterized protein n=1 Tax=Acinetobacter nematophilus TaxID=2994642 RepID=A0A9X3DV00_9GAMM|nr:hypothetical protein [Acinetobacter nematophilus]MCX5468500.1 hypothetical protein [Acinetobacter nematophilus]
MLKMIPVLFALIGPQFTNAKDIQIGSLIDIKALNCDQLFQKPESKITALLRDFNAKGPKQIKLNKSKQIMTIGGNTYSGIQGHQHYKTAHLEQDDLAVDHQVFGVRLIKIALQKHQSGKSQSKGFYFVFEGTPTTITYHLRKVVGDDWNIENTLDETPQGNSKLSCGYTR